MSDNQNSKRNVYALGETVLDIVSVGGTTMNAIPGGSVLNAAVSLGRMDVPVSLISEYGADKAGEIIEAFLKNNEVRTDFCIKHLHHKTPLALAFLDDEKKASYSFYYDVPDEIPASTYPIITNQDILLFGSFYAVKPIRRKLVLSCLQKAVEAKALIYYDLNIRKSHADSFAELLPSYLNNIAASNILKVSDEDFNTLFGLSDPDEIYKFIKPYCKVLVITRGSNPLRVFTPEFSKTYTIPEIIPVSTIGAGDNFNAGFIYGLTQTDINSESITSISIADMDMMIVCGIAFATETCLSSENYIAGNFAPDFWKKYI